TAELRVGVRVGEALPPCPSAREAAPPPHPARVGELRVNYGWGRSPRESASAANAPTRFYPAFPPPGWDGGVEGAPPPPPTPAFIDFFSPTAPPSTDPRARPGGPCAHGRRRSA